MSGRISSTSPRTPPMNTSRAPAQSQTSGAKVNRPPLQPHPSIKPANGGQTLPGLQGSGVSTGGVDAFRMSGLKNTQTGAPHQKGTPVHGSLDKVRYQNAHAQVTHTQGDGTPGLHHQQVNAQASLLHAQHDRLSKLGPVQVHSQGQAALLSTQFEAGYHLNLDKKNPQALAHIEGTAMSGAQGSVTGSMNHAHLKLSGKAEASAGAKFHASGDAVFDPRHGNVFVQGGIEASAGAGASAGGKAQFGPFIASGHVGAEAGVKWGVGGGVGMQNGVVGANFDLGGAFGSGVSAGAGVGIDTHWRPHLHHAPATPQLTRMGNITPAGARYAEQSAANFPEPGPRLQRMDNFGRRQGVDASAA